MFIFRKICNCKNYIKTDWQHKQKELQKQLEQQKKDEELAKLMKKKIKIPIYRCAVCGRADLPYIVCWVSPYIARYEERDG